MLSLTVYVRLDFVFNFHTETTACSHTPQRLTTTQAYTILHKIFLVGEIEKTSFDEIEKLE